jgi:hypothetical protein
VVFMLLRAVVLRYFKIDEIVALLTSINGRLALIQTDNQKLK